MKKLRTLVVVHASLVPPETLDGPQRKRNRGVAHRVRRRQHAAASPATKCAASACSTASRSCARVIAEWKPDIVFNLLEEFDGIVTYDQHVVAFLELLRQPYTGCNPRGLLLSRDKALCKQLLAYHRIPTPQFAVFRRGLEAARCRASSSIRCS